MADKFLEFSGQFEPAWKIGHSFTLTRNKKPCKFVLTKYVITTLHMGDRFVSSVEYRYVSDTINSLTGKYYMIEGPEKSIKNRIKLAK